MAILKKHFEAAIYLKITPSKLRRQVKGFNPYDSLVTLE